MILYAVMGTVDCPGGSDSHSYLYGIFRHEEKARRIVKNLKSVPGFDSDGEELTIEELTVDKPLPIYDCMMSN